LLEAEKIQPAPRMFLNYELSQALKNEHGAKPMKEMVHFAQEMKKQTGQAEGRMARLKVC